MNKIIMTLVLGVALVGAAQGCEGKAPHRAPQGVHQNAHQGMQSIGRITDIMVRGMETTGIT